MDVKINNKVWDIKSASPWSFTNKFSEDGGGFESLKKDDAFGYIGQGYMYGIADKSDFGGWIVINNLQENGVLQKFLQNMKLKMQQLKMLKVI